MRIVRWIVVLIAVVASVFIGIVVDRSSHSVSDTLYGAAVPVFVVWLVVGLILLVLRRRPT